MNMTQFFHYADLTWPEIADLPRNTPLVIPLGVGYSDHLLFSALGEPPRIGILPSIPFGWAGSGLRIPENVFDIYLSNLLESLRDDGFTRVYALTPPGIGMGLGSSRIALKSESHTSEHPHHLPQDTDKSKVIVIPIGHTEQHGYHLPMSTDSIIIELVANGVASASPERAYTLPVMPYGVSTHRSAFAGTLNAGGRAFEDFWIAVIDGLVERGFQRFYFLSGHGGNCSFLVNVVKCAGERHPRIFCATTWLYLSGPSGVAAIEKYRRSKVGGMGHAGELETSLMLHLQPELVHMDRVIDETDFITTPSYYMDWVEGGSLTANPPWYDDTSTGAYGAGSLATAENGNLWLEAAIIEKLSHIDEIHEQQERRETRRSSGFGQYNPQASK